MSVKIAGVCPNSPAEKAGIQKGDVLISVNSQPIQDVFDYRFFATAPKAKLVIESQKKRRRTVRLKNREDQDLGLVFETYLMDKQHSCKNKCVFCFIDQLPPNMRKSLYFKDDDARLSFLFGNYVTLTNLHQRDIDRIIQMRISPINVSVHTTDPDLRIQMMKNKRSGETLEYMKTLADGGICLNCQLVLCPGLNDGDALKRTLQDLSALGENLQSVACVPVGLTDYRQGLYPLEPYDKQSALEVLSIIQQANETAFKRYGRRVVFAADEFYLKAQEPLPDAEFYEDFSQLENGVGMLSCLKMEVAEALKRLTPSEAKRSFSIATGVDAAPYIQKLVDDIRKKWHNLDCNVYTIENKFFGRRITVTGLLTGQDIAQQLRGRNLGDYLLLSSAVLDADKIHFLDDLTPEAMEKDLGIPIYFVDNTGEDFVQACTQR